jgi:hypothetical protein
LQQKSRSTHPLSRPENHFPATFSGKNRGDIETFGNRKFKIGKHLLNFVNAEINFGLSLANFFGKIRGF